MIPLSDHHPLFCAEDVELWEVIRAARDSSSDSTAGDLPPKLLSITTWGDSLREAEAVLQGRRVRFVQDPCGAIGAVLWPASVVLARCLLTQLPQAHVTTAFTQVPPGVQLERIARTDGGRETVR